MRSVRFRWVKGLGAIALVALASAAMADTPETPAQETQRLMQSHQTERYNVPMSGTSIRAGGGRTAVNAPLAVVRQVVLDYGHYSDFIPKFQKSRVVNKSPAGTDVYLKVPILHGAASVWAVTRFAPPTPEGSGERIVASRVPDGETSNGNVDDLRAVWHLTPVDATHTVVKLEMLIVPKLPIPGSAITPELEYAADQAVSGTRDRAEANARKLAAASNSEDDDDSP